MELHDIHILDLVDIKHDLGTIRLQDLRVLMQSASALGLLRRELLGLLGTERTRRLFIRFGYAQGYLDALSVAERLARMPPSDRVLLGATMHHRQGWARVHPTHIIASEHATENGAVLEDSWEVDQQRLAFGASAGPVCWHAIGYASGFGAGVFGTDVYFKELECCATGAPRCRILGRDAAGWGAEAATLEADYCAPGDAPLAALREQLTRASEHERRQVRAAAPAPSATVVTLGEEAGDLARRHNFIVRSQKMSELLARAELVAPLLTTVLIQGESGTGKEFLARFIHERSPRAALPFVAVNCAALGEHLLESELFGHEKGAFSGAIRRKLGLVEQAGSGTLFLDEIGEMPQSLQAKLLRALENREFRRVGGEQVLRVEARVVGATNRDLKAAVTAGTFREDLFYRLGGFLLHVPPLRERPEEIPPLAHYFLHATAAALGTAVHSIRSDAMGKLLRSPWPGNVRQLRHVVEQATIVATGDEVTPADLPAHELQGLAPPGPGLDLKLNERELIEQALRTFGDNRSAAAAALHISPVTLWRRLKKYGLL